MTRGYDERQWVPIGWWVVGAGMAALTAASIHNGADDWRAVAPYVVVPLLALAVLLWLSRHRLRVEEGVLHVPGARAPWTAFGPGEVLSGEELREWRGVRAHRDAFVSVRPWSRTAVRLPVVDPEDDTPYWLVGTRRPVDLVVALETAPGTASGDSGVGPP